MPMDLIGPEIYLLIRRQALRETGNERCISAAAATAAAACLENCN